MKNYFLIITLLLYINNLEGQTFLNQACNWPFFSPNGVERPNRDSTAEDWWYDIKALDSTHVAYSDTSNYIGCGYSSFDEAGILASPNFGLTDFYTNDPCFNWIGNDYSAPSLCDFDLRDMRHMNSAGIIGLFYLDSNSSSSNPHKWIYQYGKGSVFLKVIPTSDSGFLATGTCDAFKTPGNIPPAPGAFSEQQFSLFANQDIKYQAPDATTPANMTINVMNFACNAIPTDTAEYENPATHRHACLIKVNKDGKVLWYYKYGMEPFTGNGAKAYLNSTLGTDVIELSDGYILIGSVENKSYYGTTVSGTFQGNYGGRGFIAKVNFNGILQWIKRYPEVPATTEINRFMGIRTRKSGSTIYAYVVGEKTSDKMTPYLSKPYSSWYWNSSAQIEDASYIDLKMKPFLKKIDISAGGVEKWTVDLQTGTTLNHRCNGLAIDQTGKIFVPVLTDCYLNFASGECKNSYVYQVTDNGNGATDYTRTFLRDFGPMRAFDIKMNIIATSDSGFAVAGTKKTYNISIDKNYSGTSGYDLSGCSFKTYSQTDLFVSKCNKLGNIQWTSVFDNKSFSGSGGSPYTTAGNPRNQANLDAWMSATTNRSKKDIKRQECIFAITTSRYGEIVAGGTMSANIDDNYAALIQNTCTLNLASHLIQAIPSVQNPSVDITHANNLIASVINTGRTSTNFNEVAEFVVNNKAVVNIEAGMLIDMWPGTDIGIVNTTATPGAVAEADVDIRINNLHSCAAGPVYQYKVPKGTGTGTAGRMALTNNYNDNHKQDVIVYPNPTSGFFTVFVNRSKPEEFSLQLLDISGRVVKKFQTIFSATRKISSYNINEVAPGTYILLITGINSMQQIKIVKR